MSEPASEPRGGAGARLRRRGAGPAQVQPVLKLPPDSGAVSWGDNQNGQLGNGSTAGSTSYAGVSWLSSGVTQISAGDYDNAMALTTGGAVWTWGLGLALGTGSAASSTVPHTGPRLTEVTEISAGLGYDLALCSDGTVWAWDGNPFGQLGAGNTTTIPNSTPIHVRLLEAEVSTRDKNVFTTTQAIIAYI